jgi:hypothetical protein
VATVDEAGTEFPGGTVVVEDHRITAVVPGPALLLVQGEPVVTNGRLTRADAEDIGREAARAAATLAAQAGGRCP